MSFFFNGIMASNLEYNKRILEKNGFRVIETPLHYNIIPLDDSSFNVGILNKDGTIAINCCSHHDPNMI
jgi:hypothetical protein